MNDMTAYKYIAPNDEGMSPMMRRSSDGAFVPCDLANMDYQRFLAEIDAGMKPPEGWEGPRNA